LTVSTKRETLNNSILTYKRSLTSWEERKKLLTKVPWCEILTKCGGTFKSIVSLPGVFGPVEHWEFPTASGVINIYYSDAYATVLLVDQERGLRMQAQKQEVISLVLAHGDDNLTGQIIKNWGRTLLDDLAEALPDYFEELAESGRLGDLPVSQSPAVDFALREKFVSKLVDEEATRLFSLLSGDVLGVELESWSGTEFLNIPVENRGFIVDGLLRNGAFVTIVAAAKTGKTNLEINLIHSLVDGVPFLGSFETSQFTGRVCFMDFELEIDQAQDWIRRIGIKNLDALEVFNLKGKPNPFRDEDSMAELAEHLKAGYVKALIIDPFSSIFSGDSNSNSEVKEFLKKVDKFKTLAELEIVVMAVHAGHDKGKARGASTLADHPDATWYMSNDGGTRYFKASGRDVDVEESALSFDSETGKMAFTSGSVRISTEIKIKVQILRTIQSNAHISASELDSKIRGSNASKSRAKRELVSDGSIIEHSGSAGRKTYSMGVPSFDLLALLSKS
jgi:hypothetical protein